MAMNNALALQRDVLLQLGERLCGRRTVTHRESLVV